MKLQIVDDDGFIALVNANKYQGFLDQDWQFGQLMGHFVAQMKVGNIIIWRTSNDGGGNWIVSFHEKPTDTIAFRQFEHFINVTSGTLFLVSYADLTMAAQFSGEVIPVAHNADLRIELENGWYNITVKQLFNPDNVIDEFNDEIEEKVAFEIVIMATSDNITIHNSLSSVYWTDL